MTAAPDVAAFNHIWQMFGYTVSDARNNQVGVVHRLWTDTATGSLKFIGLKTGWLPGRTHVIPTATARIDDGVRSIHVNYPATMMLGAPCHNSDVPLTGLQERTIDVYYASH